ncbi:hypothetical protein C8D90_101182 [Enterobacillus tribolii]|uniref:Uncharacterized protein n=1 Tax=Enterobacillus tribolii TaxID=1487935 RepID=A0A370R2V4_9GAMM|nr:hypothetical protein C8D90_101182 [Enterobacillus tribolii]
MSPISRRVLPMLAPSARSYMGGALAECYRVSYTVRCRR